MQAAQWVALVVGVLAMISVLATLWQRQWSEHQDRAYRASQDARVEWWRRYQWAAEQANSPDNPSAQAMGYAVLTTLSRSELVTTSERDIVRAVAAIGFGEHTGEQHNEGAQS